MAKRKHLAMTSGARISLIALGLYSAIFLRPVISEEWRDDSLGLRDWDLNFFYTESVRKSIVEYHQIPFWNPFYNGGLPVFENPQVRLFTPAMILTCLVGTIQGIKLSILIHWLLCAAGSAYLFYRVLRLRTAALFIGAVLFPFSGYLPQHLFAGHANALSVTLFPWALSFLLQYLQHGRKRYALYSAGFTAWILWDGNPYGFLQFLFLAVILTAFQSAERRRMNRLKRLFWFLLFAAALSAPRLVPEAEYMMRYGAFYRADTQSLTQSLTPSLLWDAFTSRDQFPLQSPRSPNQEYAWWEYGNYISAIPLLLLILGAPLLRRRHWPWLAVLIVLFLLMLGRFHPLSPASLLSALPGFASTRIPMRWSAAFVLTLAVVTSLLVERLILFFRGRLRRNLAFSIHAAAALLALVLAYDLRRNHDPLKQIFRRDLHARDLVTRTERTIETVATLPGYGADSAQFPAPLNFLSVRDGYEALLSTRPVHAVGDPQYRGEFHLAKSRMRVVPVTWSPNRIEFSIGTKTDDVLVLNQTYFPGWSTDTSHSVIPADGRVSVPLRAGNNSFTMCYASRAASGGTLIGLAILLAAWIDHVRRSRKSGRLNLSLHRFRAEDGA